MGDYNTQPDAAAIIRGMDSRLQLVEKLGGRRTLYDEELSEVSTTSTSYVDLGGPSATVDVPANTFVNFFFEAELKISGGGQAQIGLYEAIDVPSPSLLVLTNSSTYELVRTGGFLGAWFVLPPTSAGRRTYTVHYRATTGTGTFRNRRLWVKVGD